MNLKDKILFGIVAILRSNLFTLMVRLLKLFKTKDISISECEKGEGHFDIEVDHTVDTQDK